jgi:hypothetical protein
MHDHDQRFKNLIREFFAEFLLLFFADWAARFDCAHVEWLDKEVFADAPVGVRSILDLVAKLPAREPTPGSDSAEPQTWLALIHIEIEAPDKVAPLRPRMFRSYVYLRDRYALPVLPIGLYLKVGLNGLGIDVFSEDFWELDVVRFKYLYVGLPGLHAENYINGDNWLGVALTALMKIPKDQIAQMGADALRRITESPLSDQKRYLLAECVQAYMENDATIQEQFAKLMLVEKYSGVRAMNKTWFEQGEEKGIEKGRRELIREQIEDRFGPLPPRAAERLQQMPLIELIPFGKSVWRAQSLSDLGLDK